MVSINSNLPTYRVPLNRTDNKTNEMKSETESSQQFGQPQEELGNGKQVPVDTLLAFNGIVIETPGKGGKELMADHHFDNWADFWNSFDNFEDGDYVYVKTGNITKCFKIVVEGESKGAHPV